MPHGGRIGSAALERRLEYGAGEVGQRHVLEGAAKASDGGTRGRDDKYILIAHGNPRLL
ncbi:hypothetical protein D3C85_1775590 [compost metagenome]